MTHYRWKRILLTGAAGRIGAHLRTGMQGLAPTIRLTDLRELGPAAPGEELQAADLSDMEAVRALMEGVEAVLHFGAVMPQQPWERVLPANIVGTFNVFEAARQAGVRRIVYASSSHAIGMYPCTELLDADSPPRPDTLYGLSKAFGENLARMYHDKHGMDVACLRIGSCFEKPTDERMLATWLSHRDAVQLARRCLEAPSLGYTVIYGLSANTRRWWTNEKAAFLGYAPQDSADDYAAELAVEPAAPSTDSHRPPLQGGRFVHQEP